MISRFKKLLCLIFCLFLVISLALPVSARPTSLKITYLDTAPVHYRPDEASAKIGYLPQGIQLTVLGKEDAYYHIDCYDMSGYIHERFVSIIDNEYFIRCLPDSDFAEAFLEQPIHTAIFLQRRIYTLSTAQIGVPYVSGGTSPRGFDCSGFTQYIFTQIGISIPRTCDAQLGAGLIIPKEQLRCGDLVLFAHTTSHRGIATHVGIYLGDGKLIHAGSKGITVVELESSYFQNHYLCARRIIPSERIQPDFSSAALFAHGK